MKMEFEYGKGTVEAKLPDNTDIFIPGETVKDPEYIPEEQLEKAYLESLGASYWDAAFIGIGG